MRMTPKRAHIIYIGTLLCTAALSTTRTDLGPGNGFIVGKILNSRAFIKLSALLISRIFTESDRTI